MPLHRQLFLVLRDQISQGAYGALGALPSEEALCERFGVSRITVRRALSDLSEQGFVERRHGRGTFVHPDLVNNSRANLTFLESLQRVAQTTSVTVLSVERAIPPIAVALQLGLKKDQVAVRALRLRSIRGTPVMLTDAWLPEKWGGFMSENVLRKQALYEVLLHHGVRFGPTIQELSAVSADPVQATHLHTEVGSPLLKLARLMFDVDRNPLVLLTVYLAPERSRMLMEIPGEALNTLSAGQFVHDV